MHTQAGPRARNRAKRGTFTLELLAFAAGVGVGDLQSAVEASEAAVAAELESELGAEEVQTEGMGM